MKFKVNRIYKINIYDFFCLFFVSSETLKKLLGAVWQAVSGKYKWKAEKNLQNALSLHRQQWLSQTHIELKLIKEMPETQQGVLHSIAIAAERVETKEQAAYLDFFKKSNTDG